MSGRIRVVVVDDSPTVRDQLASMLRRDPGFEVVGEAGDGHQAVKLCVELRPDVMTLDLVLPGLNGLGVTEYVMGHAPTPILIVSASMNRGEVHDTYHALAAGAVDVLDKARAAEPDWEGRFVAAVRMASRIKVITHPRARLGDYGRARMQSSPPAMLARAPVELVAIGASTGGPGALVEVLSAVPTTFMPPILVLLHIDRAFAVSFADWLGSQIKRHVICAQSDELLDRMAGRILLAPPDAHLVVSHRRIKLVADPPRNYCRPSVDVLFESLALDYKASAAAALLTGMGRDGAAGMLAIRSAGGRTIAQDEATSVVWGMPREAIAFGAAEAILPLREIGPAITRWKGPGT